LLQVIQDEPSLNQSDQAAIAIRLDNSMKQYRGGKYNKIHAIENADKNPKQIMTWINSVAEIHKNKQPPSVSYSRPMPDIDSLMQVWPAEVEDVLNEIKLPSEDLDVSLE
jgi:intraflagellar transport protein 46